MFSLTLFDTIRKIKNHPQASGRQVQVSAHLPHRLSALLCSIVNDQATWTRMPIAVDQRITFGRWLKQQRHTHDLSQEMLAEQIGCAPSTLQKIEQGVRRPSRTMAERIVEALAVPVAEQASLLHLARSSTAPGDADNTASDGLLSSDAHAGVDPLDRTARSAFSTESRQALRLPTLLPAPELIGREADLADLLHRLRATSQRLITVIGPGGIGKTSLVLRTAATLAAGPETTFSDGIAIAPLAAIVHVNDVPLAIATALGLPAQNARPMIERLVDALRDRALLLILDNLEQLLSHTDGAKFTALLSRLLEEAPGLRILTTSRERLGIQDEWVLALGGLDVPTTDQTGLVAQASAVRLFVERAQQVLPSFTLGATHSAIVAQIVRRLEGSPLAIELAASWTRALTLAEIAAELDHALTFLTRSERDRRARHHSMRAALDHSWQLLDAAEQLTLARLSVFRGSCDRAAATTITGATLPTLTTLIDKSLVRREDVSGITRYSLHELVRQYAAEQLAIDQDDHAATNSRHSTYYAALLQNTITKQTGGSSPEAWTKAAGDIENGRVAWMHAATTGDTALVLAMARALMIVYDVQGWVLDGATLFEQAAAALRASQASSEAALGVTLGYQGYFLIRAGRLLAAAPLLEEAGRLLEAAGELAEYAHVLLHLGTLEYSGARFANAQARYDQAAQLTSASGDHFTRLWAIYFQGRIALAMGALPMAEQHLGVCVEAWRSQGYSRGLALALTMLAETMRLAGQWDAAKPYLHESLQIASAIHDQLATAMCLRELGALAVAQGDLEAAHELLVESCAAVRELDAPRFYGRCRAVLVQLEVQRGELAAARQGCDELLRVVRDGVTVLLPEVAYGLALLMVAERSEQEALALLIALENMPGEYATLQLAADLRARLERALAPNQRVAAARIAQQRQLPLWLAEITARSTAAQPPTPLRTEPIVPEDGLYVPETGAILSPREVEVLRLLIAGASNPGIAEALIISRFTVKNHVARILEKLGVTTRTQAALRGRELGLLPLTQA
jgi:predicted ATPase/DNA-binding NarL/FixJ family response regulator/transcriptional regulator with XRE-family HTH domain